MEIIIHFILIVEYFGSVFGLLHIQIAFLLASVNLNGFLYMEKQFHLTKNRKYSHPTLKIREKTIYPYFVKFNMGKKYLKIEQAGTYSY